MVVQQPQPSSSEASGDSSDESSASHRIDETNRPVAELQTKIPDSNTTLQEYEPENYGQWYKGLCECCDPGCECRRCCITCCLWPITISRNAEAVGLSNSYTWPWMLTFSIGLCFCTSCLTRAVLRTQIRQKYGIPGSHCNGKNFMITSSLRNLSKFRFLHHMLLSDVHSMSRRISIEYNVKIIFIR